MSFDRSWDDARRRRAGSRVARCSSENCRAPIVWAFTDAGRKMPFDAVPVEDGDWYFVDGKAVKVIGGLDHTIDRFHTHFKTCPDAAKFRGAKDYVR